MKPIPFVLGCAFCIVPLYSAVPFVLCLLYSAVPFVLGPIRQTCHLSTIEVWKRDLSPLAPAGTDSKDPERSYRSPGFFLSQSIRVAANHETMPLVLGCAFCTQPDSANLPSQHNRGLEEGFIPACSGWDRLEDPEAVVPLAFAPGPERNIRP